MDYVDFLFQQLINRILLFLKLERFVAIYFSNANNIRHQLRIIFRNNAYGIAALVIYTISCNLYVPCLFVRAPVV